MARNTLVTGGAGFIGSHICEALVRRGDHVAVIDNLVSGNMDNLEAVRADVEFIQSDIRDLEMLNRIMPGIDCVFHHAALPSVPLSMKRPLEFHEVNSTGTLNVLLAARDAGVKRVVYAASSSAYGDDPTQPKTEDLPPQPLSPYALTKLSGEYYCRLFSTAFNLETIGLRYFNVFGPRQSPESQYAAVIPKFIEAFLTKQVPKIFGDGEQTRDFIFVENVVQANLLAAMAPKTGGEIVNIATSTGISLNSLITVLQELTGMSPAPEYLPERPGDVKHSVADISQARALLNFEPRIDFKQGLRQTLEWMRGTL